MNEALRVVYFGTPQFAVPALLRLAADPQFHIALVVTRPDRPAGRGHLLAASPVKMAAERLNLPIYQPASLRGQAEREFLVDAGADLFVVAAFGLIFGPRT